MLSKKVNKFDLSHFYTNTHTRTHNSNDSLPHDENRVTFEVAELALQIKSVEMYQ